MSDTPGVAPRRPSIRGPNPRSAARLAAVQAVYQAEMSGGSAETVTAEFVKWRLGAEIDGDTYVPADEGLFRALAVGTLTRMTELDPLLARTLSAGWPLDRIETILRAILRVAAFELVARPEVPVRVVITEYVDVAHAFFGGKEPGLVNGVLDRLAHELRPAEWQVR